MKKSDYSCFLKRERGIINPLKNVKRWGRNIKYAYQRIRYGYCDKDVWSIDWWFLSVVPNMLEDLKNTAHSYPYILDCLSHVVVGTGAPKETDEACINLWTDILSEMIFLFREAHECTCTRENIYETEYQKAREEFMKKYGSFGDKIKNEEEKGEEKNRVNYRMYTLGNVPEYADIYKLYFEEAGKIDEYRDECKDKGLDLFKEWFWHLWD